MQWVHYAPDKVTCATFDVEGRERLRLPGKPNWVAVAGEALVEQPATTDAGWTWDPLTKGDVVEIRRGTGRHVEVEF